MVEFFLRMHIWMHENLRKCMYWHMKLWLNAYLNAWKLWVNVSFWMYVCVNAWKLWVSDCLDVCMIFYFCFFFHENALFSFIWKCMYKFIRPYENACINVGDSILIFFRMHVRMRQTIWECIYECMWNRDLSHVERVTNYLFWKEM